MTFDKTTTDYSLYLVTNNEMIPEGLSIYDQVEKALANGTTIVQLREKDLETKEFITRASKIHELTRSYNVPLIINDRVDVALAIDAEGVHVGQDDMDFNHVRSLIGDDKIIGVSCGNTSEVLEVIKSPSKVDYIGIGPVYDTSTKKLTKIPFGTSGIRECLKTLRDNDGLHIKSVIIGGLNKSNIQRVLYTSSIPGKATDGVAVVSCIMAQEDAAMATVETLKSIKEVGPWVKAKAHQSAQINVSNSCSGVLKKAPMVHHITNDVVKNFSANVSLAIGASPIMSELEEEFTEFGKFPNTALLLNTGTPSESQVQMYIKAIDAYNKAGTPIVYDPVGCGASTARRASMRKLLNQSYFSVIKGNAGEILTAAGASSQMKGVDSGTVSSQQVLLDAATKLALEQRCVVVVTGERDLIVDGFVSADSVTITNDHCHKCYVSGGAAVMGSVTGSGCSLGSVIAAFVASDPAHVFNQTVAAVELYKQAGFNASKKSNGPGTFVPHFIDELYNLTRSGEFPDTTLSST